MTLHVPLLYPVPSKQILAQLLSHSNLIILFSFSEQPHCDLANKHLGKKENLQLLLSVEAFTEL